MENKRLKKCLNISLKVLLAMMAALVLLPLSLYIPFVQNCVKSIACSKVSDATGWTVTIDRLLLKFPVDLSVDGVLVLDEKRDTMLSADNLYLDVKVLPLLKMTVDIEEANLKNAKYRMVSEDSSMVLSACIKSAKVDLAEIALKNNVVQLGETKIKGGDINLDYYPDKVKPSEEDSVKTPWIVKASHITLDSIRYRMSMLPTIDAMDVMVGHGELKDGFVDTGKALVNAKYLGIDGVDLTYKYPTPEYAEKHPVKVVAEKNTAATDTTLWTVKGDVLRLTNSHAVYAMSGVKPSAGLDMDYMELSDINIAIDSLYNKGMEVVVPLKGLSAKERCGVAITDATGTFRMDSIKMAIERFKLNTVVSEINADGKLDMSVFEVPSSGKMHLNAKADIDISDIERMFPIYKNYLKSIPRSRPMKLVVKVDGTSKRLKMKTLYAELPKYARIVITGEVENAMDVDNLGGELTLDGRFDNLNFVKPTMFDAQMSKQINFPAMHVKGKASLKGNTMAGNADVILATGDAVGKAKFNTVSDAYDVDLNLRNFPMHSVMPLSTLGDISARLQAKGKGFDVMKSSTYTDFAFAVDHLEYNDKIYQDIKGQLTLKNGVFDAQLDSKNPNIDFGVLCNGELKKDHYIVALDGDIRDLNLQALRVMDVNSRGAAKVTAYGDIDVKRLICDFTADVNDLSWTYDTMSFVTPSVSLQVESTDTTIMGILNNEDMSLNFNSQVGVKQFLEKMTRCQNVADYQMKHISLNIDTLQSTLPPFECELEMGKNGLVQQYLGYNDIKLKKMSFELYNDTTIYGNSVLQGIDAYGTKVDTITARLVQVGKYLGYKLHMGNKPGTMDNFANVTLYGGILGSRLTTIYDAKDIKQRTGYHFGTHADVNDSIVRVNVFTNKPYIGYREWSVNEDNYVQYNYKDQHLDANLRLDGGNSGFINLFTEHVEGEDHDDEGHTHKHQEDVNLQIKGVKIEEWVSMFPFAPDVSGELSSDMKISYRGHQFWGTGKAGLKNFCYEGNRVGDFDLDALMTLDPETGNTNLESYMNVNGAKVAFAAGVLNDSTATSPMSLKLSIDKFPISTMSAFIPDGIAELQGYLNGEMSMTGTFDKPIFTGSVTAEDGAVYVPVFGSKILFPTTEIPVDSSVVYLNNYALRSCNDKPLVLNGLIDIHEMSNPYVNLGIQGKNVQFVDSKQIRKSQLFGRGFADIKADVKGKTSALYVNADMSLLSGSNLTYVLQEDVSEIVPATNPDMVKFVHFDDSVGEYADSLLRAEPFGININATISLQQGNIINAYLSPDGKNRVQVQSTGSLNYYQGFSGDPRVTGRLTVDNGYVKYSPPLIKEVNFTINEGSNISFTGNMLNPNLDFSAVEKYKATVSGDGTTSHLVDFLITCNVGGTLSQMDVGFDLATNDDLTVQNELQSMTAQQRSAQAMNLMLYGSYTGANTSTMSNNALYSFLNSQINSWAASAIKGVDLSFGINQYDKNSGKGVSTVTSYSYNLSKSLFNDRFKIVVGGNYSTDASAEDNFSDNLISDISIEYLLNNSGSMYARLFRHTGYESILEGEIIQTGVGFVIKRKLASLKNIFKFRASRRAAARRRAQMQADSIRNASAPIDTTMIKP